MFSGVFRSYQDCRSPASNDGSVCECDWECHERSNYRVRAFLGDGSASVKYIYKSKDPVDAEDKAKSLLDINPEGRLLREIKDILDELHIMINIKKQQHRAFKQFRKHVEYMIAPPLSLAKEIGTARQKKITGDSDIEDDDSGTPGKAIKRIDSLERDKMEKSAKWTLEFAHDLAADLDDRVADLNNLRESAEHTEKALNELLGLKQQRASVVQARKSVQQTEETLRKGRSIMLFTIIIIIFQPLSFGATVFGMNSYEFEGGKWSFRREITYILPISVGIILTSFILAFSPFTRSLLFLLFSVSWTWLVTSTRIYNLWIQFKIDSQHLTKVRKDTVRKWKESARAEKQERNEAKQKAKDKKRMEVLRNNINIRRSKKSRYVIHSEPKFSSRLCNFVKNRLTQLSSRRNHNGTKLKGFAQGRRTRASLGPHRVSTPPSSGSNVSTDFLTKTCTMESPTPPSRSHHRRPTMYTSPSNSTLGDAEYDVNALQDLHKSTIASDEDDINKMDPITYPSSASSRIVSTVQITGPTDYFTYTPGTDPTQPVSPLSFETTQSTTPPKNVVSPNQTSPTQAPLPPLPQPSTLSPKSDIKTLNSALSIVRSHLSSLDAGIKRNIAAQAFAISSTCNSKKSDLPNHTISPVQVKENSRGPEFKIEDAHTSGAVLDTVKVCCVLERGLEAFIEVLGKVERDHKDELLSGANTPEMGLMDICIEKGAYVKRVMGSADEGVKSVVEFDGKKSH